MEAPGGGSLTARVVGDIRELTRSSFGQIWVCPWYPSCSEEPTAWHCSCSHKVGELSRQQRVLQIAGLLRAEFDSRARARAEAEERAVRMSRSLRRRGRQERSGRIRSLDTPDGALHPLGSGRRTLMCAPSDECVRRGWQRLWTIEW